LHHIDYIEIMHHCDTMTLTMYTVVNYTIGDTRLYYGAIRLWIFSEFNTQK